MGDNMTNEVLCIYRDEAIGASAVPLTVSGDNINVQKSSDYFAGLGIAVSLTLDSNNSIQQINLGPDINVQANALKRGIEVGPFGCLPVHIIQTDKNFDFENGGVLRFGFLKTIFSWKSVGIFLKNLVLSFMTSKNNNLSTLTTDLCQFWQNYYGVKGWGSFEIFIAKDDSGKWSIYTDEPQFGGMLVNELVAKFKVNKAGVVTGIEEMYTAMIKL